MPTDGSRAKSFMKFFLGVQKIWTGHKIHNLRTPLVTLTLSQPCWNMGSTCRLVGENIWIQFHEVPSRG
jgi:hypothetical protein